MATGTQVPAGECRGLQRAAALAGRAMAGRGDGHGHESHASALGGRIPRARRDNGERGDSERREQDDRTGAGGRAATLTGPGHAGQAQDRGQDDGQGTDRTPSAAGARSRPGADGEGDGEIEPPPGFAAAPAATYWRRRFAILAIGLSLLAAASWTLSQALKVTPAAPSPSSGQQGQGSGTRAAPGHPGHRTAGSGAGLASARGGRASGPAAKHQPGPRPSATTRGFGGFKPAFCSWHSIVLSLSAAQAHYGPGEQPSFSLSVVSTQPTACSFNIGPSHLALVIKEGPARIWSSADCVSGSGNLVAALHRGVPTLVTIGWDRQTSSPGCTGPARSVPPGTYTGYAVDGSLTSGPVPIRLG